MPALCMLLCWFLLNFLTSKCCRASGLDLRSFLISHPLYLLDLIHYNAFKSHVCTDDFCSCISSPTFRINSTFSLGQMLDNRNLTYVMSHIKLLMPHFQTCSFCTPFLAKKMANPFFNLLRPMTLKTSLVHLISSHRTSNLSGNPAKFNLSPCFQLCICP